METAAVLVLEPIVEADLPPEQYAYRRDRSALDAVREVHELINTGYGEVVDADLSSYFDSIPHTELLKSVARRVVEGAMLHLIKMWLEAAVEEADERGNKRRSTRNRDDSRGTPQGSPISPLLSNLYMRRFVLGWKKLGHEQRLKARIVNYADDLVICCRGGGAQALAAMRDMMRKLRLTVNDTKTRVCKLPGEKFDFLGYSFGRYYSPRTGRPYLGLMPSKQRVCVAISAATRRNQTQQDAEALVASLNRLAIGWANYFRLGLVSKAYRAVDRHTRRRLRQWLCAKHKLRGVGTMRYPDDLLHFTRRIIGFGVAPADLDGPVICWMFNRAIAKQTPPKYLSSDNDPLFRFHRWCANLRILEVDEIKTIPCTPLSHPFVERLIGTVRREYLDRTFFWNRGDLERKLDNYQAYYNQHRCHTGLAGATPAERSGGPTQLSAKLESYTWRQHCRVGGGALAR